jgi:hypothetical protein
VIASLAQRARLGVPRIDRVDGDGRKRHARFPVGGHRLPHDALSHQVSRKKANRVV